MSVDYSIMFAAQEEFEGHFIRDFLNRRTFVSYGNIEMLAMKYCKIMCDMFDTTEVLPLSYNKAYAHDPDSMYICGTVRLKSNESKIIFAEKEYNFLVIKIYLNISPTHIGFQVSFSDGSDNVVAYDYRKFFQYNLENVINNISYVLSESPDVINALEIWKSSYEY